MMTQPERRFRILVVSGNYPNDAAPQRGLWVERMCDTVSAEADVSVVVPTPWVPPFFPLKSIARFRKVPAGERRNGVEVFFPRVPGSIDYYTHGLDARLSAGRVIKLCRKLHSQRPFDLIHAHFIYPDGVVAARLGQELGIPVMTSEHAFWRPWLVDRPAVGRQVDAALPGIKLVAPVSEFLKEDVDDYLANRAATMVLPNVVDDLTFFPEARERDPHQLLYVGLIRQFKRVDVLVRAFALARDKVPDLRLKILSAKSFAYSKDRKLVHELIASLDLSGVIEIVTGSDAPAVAEEMRRCSFVVVSSTRHETFCSVAAESLACGTPLVITRCGGPEEFVTEADGVMVDADDPVKLSRGILEGLQRRDSFDEADIARRMVEQYGRDAWRQKALGVYEGLID